MTFPEAFAALSAACLCATLASCAPATPADTRRGPTPVGSVAGAAGIGTGPGVVAGSSAMPGMSMIQPRAGSAAAAAGFGPGGAAAPVGLAGVGGVNSGRAGSGGAVGAVPPTGGATSSPPVSCAQPLGPYKVTASMLDASFVPAAAGNNWGGAGDQDVRTMVAVDPATNKVYVGWSQSDGQALASMIAAEGGAASAAIKIPNSVLGGLAVTKDGLGALLYDPNPSVDQRLWAAVKRVSFTGDAKFSTDLFRSANLTDDMTKGNPARGRLSYIENTDVLVAYFGHMQLLQGVRHQGGYFATLSASGAQTVLSGWFGSHNLDQRLLIDGTHAAALSLGDAYPKGFYFSFSERPQTKVIYTVAVSGDGAANGQVGGLTVLSDVLVASFVTDRSIAPTVTAGDWPNIDATISMQIRNGATNGTDVGLLVFPKTAVPAAEVAPIWVNLQPASGAHIASLKTVRYGSGDALLLAWAETTGTWTSKTATYYTMVVDRSGAVCQAKQKLEPGFELSYDDMVRRSDGAIVWANGLGNRVHVVTLTPQ
jgi:hypothetical protein